MKKDWKKIVTVPNVLMVAVFVAVIGLAQNLSGTQSLFSRASGTLAQVSVLPATSTLPPNTSYQVWFTSDEAVGFVALVVTFDPTKITLTGEPAIVLPGFNRIALTSMADANATGRITMTAGLDPGRLASAPTGAHQYADLPFAAVGAASGQTMISIDLAGTQIVNLAALTLTLSGENASIALNPTSGTIAPTTTIPPIATPTPTRVTTPTPTSLTMATPTPTPAPTPGDQPPALEPPTVFTSRLKHAIIGRKYSAKVEARDRTSGDRLQMTISGLPDGLSLDLDSCRLREGNDGTSLNCQIVGRATQLGIFYPVVTVRDSLGEQASKTLTLEVVTIRKFIQNIFSF